MDEKFLSSLISMYPKKKLKDKWIAAVDLQDSMMQ